MGDGVAPFWVGYGVGNNGVVVIGDLVPRPGVAVAHARDGVGFHFDEFGNDQTKVDLFLTAEFTGGGDLVFVMVGGIIFEVEAVVLIDARAFEANRVEDGVEHSGMYGEVDDKASAVDDFA